MPHPLPPPRPIVAGVDGCRAGWLVVLHDPATNTHAARVVTAGFAALLALPEAPATIAVDIPIGLLDVAATGGRACEIAARERLPGRTSSVFSSPTRPALAAQQRPGAGYGDVVAANRSGLDGAPGISQQAFAILPEIGEVDAALTPALQAVVREIHPELCFATPRAPRWLTPRRRAAARPSASASRSSSPSSPAATRNSARASCRLRCGERTGARREP